MQQQKLFDLHHLFLHAFKVSNLSNLLEESQNRQECSERKAKNSESDLQVCITSFL